MGPAGEEKGWDGTGTSVWPPGIPKRTWSAQPPPSRSPLLRFLMALLLWTLLAACLPAVCAGQVQATFGPDVEGEEGAQTAALRVHAVGVPSEDDRLPQAGTESESQGAPRDPTKLPPHFADEAAGQGELGLGGFPNSLEGEEEEEEGCQDQDLSGSVGQIASAMRALGVDLLREMEAEDGTGNAILSPLSISLALAHLALGAANQTQKQLLEVLRMDSVPCLHQALRGVTRHLHRTALSIAGRLFLEKGFPIKEEFLEASQRFYGAKPALLSGDSQADLEAINRWVKEATHGKISTMLTELPPRIVMVLLNAVYFRGFWKTKFSPLLTEPSLFHLDEESAVSVDMMKERNFPLSWFSTKSFEAEVAKFPFKGNTTFVAIVPDLHLRKNFSQVLSEVLQLDLKTSFPRERSTMVKMPKLDLEHYVDLNGALTRLGLGELFSAPDLRHIAEGPLVVSSIQHRATLELAEAGVQAAAATSVIAFRSVSAFSLDRPFLFMITEDATGIPFFLGTIRNPCPRAPPEKTGRDPLGEKDVLPVDPKLHLWKP